MEDSVYIDATREVEEYVIAYFGGASRAKRPYKYRAIISLYNSAGLFGALYFHDDANYLPDTDQLGEERLLKSHFLMRDFESVLDILRNENPVFFHQVAHWPTMGVITTSRELVGEGEIWRSISQ